MSRKIRKAVIPAAGLGTRLLPATKVLPKEMIPVAGKPLIQYAVEEAVASGIETIIFVTREAHPLLVDHFSSQPEIEDLLRRQGKEADADVLRQIAETVHIHTVIQKAPRGLGDAIGCAREQIGSEPFVVLLPDVIIDSIEPCTVQLIRAYNRDPGCIIAVRTVPAEYVHLYGVLNFENDRTGRYGRLRRATSLSEKPANAKQAMPGIFGRYVLEPEIFDLIEVTAPGRGGEIQLTDALNEMCMSAPVYGFYFEGEPYDAGNWLGLLQASIELSLNDEALRGRLEIFLSEIKAKRFASAKT